MRKRFVSFSLFIFIFIYWKIIQKRMASIFRRFNFLHCYFFISFACFYSHFVSVVQIHSSSLCTHESRSNAIQVFETAARNQWTVKRSSFLQQKGNIRYFEYCDNNSRFEKWCVMCVAHWIVDSMINCDDVLLTLDSKRYTSKSIRSVNRLLIIYYYIFGLEGRRW